MNPTAFVSCSSREIPRARAVMAKLQEAGFTFPFDWTVPVERYGTHGVTMPRSARAEAANGNIEAVESVNSFVMLWPGPGIPSIGMYVELGIALSRHRRSKHGFASPIHIVISGSPTQNGVPEESIWHAWLAEHHTGHAASPGLFQKDEDAIESAVWWAQNRSHR